LPRRAVENGRGGSVRSAGGPAQQGPQVVHHRREHSSVQPASRLLIDRLPGREVARQVTPGSTRVQDPAQRIEDFAQVVPARRRSSSSGRERRRSTLHHSRPSGTACGEQLAFPCRTRTKSITGFSRQRRLRTKGPWKSRAFSTPSAQCAGARSGSGNGRDGMRHRAPALTRVGLQSHYLGIYIWRKSVPGKRRQPLDPKSAPEGRAPK
jgi:hypothetical protein